MATMIPGLSTIRGMLPGERRLGQRLATLLQADYIAWHDIPLGRQRRYPDYIILHPGRGLPFLEVKDWKLETLKVTVSKRVELQTSNGLGKVNNPREQVRHCAYVSVNQLKLYSQLQQEEGYFDGCLCFPYDGAVFPNITHKQWNAAVKEQAQELALPPRRLICRDKMTAAADLESFWERVWDIFEYTFGEELTLPQIDGIRWRVSSEVKINAHQNDMFSDNDAKVHHVTIPDIVPVMFLQLGQLAKSIGDSHGVLHGVSGSSKILIFGCCCMCMGRAIIKTKIIRPISHGQEAGCESQMVLNKRPFLQKGGV